MLVFAENALMRKLELVLSFFISRSYFKREAIPSGMHEAYLVSGGNSLNIESGSWEGPAEVICALPPAFPI